ncbi:MAG TPA: hypothetical protein VJ550_03610 [Geomonas sp.]|nr:hypothetical protein [Geomonas sp.]
MVQHILQGLEKLRGLLGAEVHIGAAHLLDDEWLEVGPFERQPANGVTRLESVEDPLKAVAGIALGVQYGYPRLHFGRELRLVEGNLSVFGCHNGEFLSEYKNRKQQQYTNNDELHARQDPSSGDAAPKRAGL